MLPPARRGQHLATAPLEHLGLERGVPLVTVGYDARRGSADFARDTAAVLTAAGAQVVLLLRPLPTPVLAFAVRHLNADAGVMVTASHNPPADNGYKVYLGGRMTDEAGRGAQIVSPADERIAAQIRHTDWTADIPMAEAGWKTAGEDLVDAYRAAALSVLDDAADSGWYGGADQPPPWWAFWFISVLFFVTVLRRLLEHLPSWIAWAVALTGLVLAHVIPESGLARTPLGVGLALPCLSYVLCGESFRRDVMPRLRRHRAVLGTALVLVGILAVRLGLPPHNIKFSGFGAFLLTPLVGVVMAAGMVLVFSTFVERQLRTLARRTGTGRALRSSTTALTRTGTVVVLLHGLVLMELMRLGVEDNLAKFTVTLGLSWAVGLALLATPLSRALTGVPQQWHAIGPASTGARP